MSTLVLLLGWLLQSVVDPSVRSVARDGLGFRQEGIYYDYQEFSDESSSF